MRGATEGAGKKLTSTAIIFRSYSLPGRTMVSTADFGSANAGSIPASVASY